MWAVSRMYKKDASGKPVYMVPLSKEKVDELLQKYNIMIEKVGYDYVYAANMCMADYMGSSIEDERHVALFIKDYVSDPDAYNGMPFTRFYADCIGSGTPIDWEDML